MPFLSMYSLFEDQLRWKEAWNDKEYVFLTKGLAAGNWKDEISLFSLNLMYLPYLFSEMFNFIWIISISYGPYDIDHFRAKTTLRTRKCRNPPVETGHFHQNHLIGIYWAYLNIKIYRKMYVLPKNCTWFQLKMFVSWNISSI